MELREYQKDLSSKAMQILDKYKIVYLAMETRTGKTITALSIASGLNYTNILFVTKKKAIGSIESDVKFFPKLNLTVINFESVKKVAGDFDLIIVDEAHSCFLGHTKIDGVKIKDIKVGDKIKSFNFALNKYELKKVLKVYKNTTKEKLIKIKCNGKEIICTESHEIYTDSGWKSAKDITIRDKLQVV